MMTAVYTLEDHPKPGHALQITYKEVTSFTSRVTIERIVDGEADGGITLSLNESEWLNGVFARLGIGSRNHF